MHVPDYLVAVSPACSGSTVLLLIAGVNLRYGLTNAARSLRHVKLSQSVTVIVRVHGSWNRTYASVCRSQNQEAMPQRTGFCDR